VQQLNSDLEKEINSEKHKYNLLLNENKEILDELKKSHNREISELAKQLSDRDSLISSLQEKIENDRVKYEELLSDLENEKLLLEESDKTIQSNRMSIEEFEMQLQNMSHTITSQNNDIQRLTLELQDMESKWKRSIEENENLVSDSTRLQVALSNASDIENMSKTNNLLENEEVVRLRNALLESEKIISLEREKLKSARQERNDKVSELVESRKVIQSKVDSEVIKTANLSAQISELWNINVDLRSQKTILDRKVDTLTDLLGHVVMEARTFCSPNKKET
jgi:hypothetical protein